MSRRVSTRLVVLTVLVVIATRTNLMWGLHSRILFERASSEVDLGANSEAIKSSHQVYARPTVAKATNAGWLQSYSDQAATEAVTPIWNCHDTTEARQQQKFVFVHVFKTAGSSMRQWLRDYAFKYGFGYSTIVSCTNVEPNTMIRHSQNGKASLDQRWDPCRMKDHIGRNSGHVSLKATHQFVHNSYLETEVDILAGHFRIGSFNQLRTPSNASFQIKYFSFFRSAIMKFISSKLYIKMRHSNVTVAEVIKDICTQATNGVKNGKYYSKYSEYLLTPSQRRMYRLDSKQNEALLRNATQVMMGNLVEHNVLIGIVERMDASMELLHHVLGVDPKPKPQKEQMISTPLNHKNPSKIPSHDLLQTIKDQHTDCYATLVEFMKYEQAITDFAMKMHVKQYAAFFKKERGENS